MYLYIKARDPQHMMLRHVKISGMFSNPEEIQGLNCNTEDNCEDILDIEYPIEDSLVSPLVQMIIQELIPTLSIAGDNNNNAKEATLNETREV